MSASAESSASHSEDPLITARRDFEAIKNSKAAPESPVRLRQQETVPLVDTTTDAPVPLSPIQRARKLEALKEQSKAAASRHWLLEAMGVEAPSAETGPGEMLPTDAHSSIDSVAKGPTVSTPRVREVAPNASHAKEAAPKVVAGAAAHVAPNPLQPYMAGWLSAGDVSLLQSPVPSAVIKNDLGSNAPASLGSLTPGVVPTADASVFSSPTANVRVPTPSRASNPYLSDVPANMFVAAPTKELPAVLPQPPSPNVVPTVVVPEPAPILQPNPTEAEKLKRAEDGKYFRQLKRF